MLVGNGRTVDPKQQHVALMAAGLREETLQHVYSGHALQQQLTFYRTPDINKHIGQEPHV